MEDAGYELIRSFLSGCFNHEFYSEGIRKARQAISSNMQTRNNWTQLKLTVKDRKLKPGQPLALVNHGANQVIDENSDQEAYIWLDKMIYNVERRDGRIDEY